MIVQVINIPKLIDWMVFNRRKKLEGVVLNEMAVGYSKVEENLHTNLSEFYTRQPAA